MTSDFVKHKSWAKVYRWPSMSIYLTKKENVWRLNCGYCRQKY